MAALPWAWLGECALLRCVHPCAAKTCVVRPGGGEAGRSRSKNLLEGPRKAMLGQGHTLILPMKLGRWGITTTHNQETRTVSTWFCEGLIRHRPPGPTLESASPPPSSGLDLASIQHRIGIETTSISRFDHISMSNRCKIDPEEGGVRRIRGWGPGACA